jgi:predicted metal-dependent hydrolase
MNLPSDTYTFTDLICAEGEAFFVRAVASFAKHPNITSDPVLSADVKAFINQEAQHAGEHSAYNRDIGKKFKHDQEKMTNLVKWILSLPPQLAPLFRSDPNMICLGITCSLEHFTAILAELLLCTSNGAACICAMEPSHRYLWVWHAIEETEHKAVAFDVYKNMEANYFARCLRHVITTVIFVIVVMYVWASYLYDAGKLFSLQTHVDLHYFLWLYPGILRKLIPLWLEYFHPRFHPWTFRNAEHAKKMLAVWNKRLQDQSLTTLTTDDCAGHYD